MQSLSSLLASQCTRPIGTVLHLGAGGAIDVDVYARLKPARSIFVEGDSETATELENRTSQWPATEVHAKVIAAQSGQAQWNRYNMRTLNGPLDADALTVVYPRLRRIGSMPVQAVGLGDFLSELAISPTKGADHVDVLVLDVPGQELALLASVSPAQWQSFGYVLMRGCRNALGQGSAAASEAIELLCQSGFEVIASDEGLWPSTVLRLDDARVRTMQVLHLATQRDAELAAARAAIAELTLQNERLGAESLEQRSLAAQRAQEVSELVVACKAHAKVANDRVLESEHLSQAKAEFEHVAYVRHLELEALKKVSADVERLAHERHLRIEELNQSLAVAQQALAERDAEVVRLSGERDEIARACAQQAAQLQASLAENERLAAEMARQVVQLEAAGKRTAELESANASLLGQSRDQVARQRLMDSEILKAEAQLELIKDVLLREKNF